MILEIKDKSVLHYIQLENIMYCKAEGNYTCFILRDRKVTTYSTLKQISEKLSDYDFFRCHNSILVNLNEITEFDCKKNLVILKNKLILPVSLRKKRLLQSALKAFIRSTI